MFRNLTVRGMTWPEWVRATVFDIFLRPVFEYGPPVLWCLRQLRGSGTLLDDVTSLHKDMVKWIMSSPTARPVASLADMPVSLDRFEALAMTFVLQIERMHLQTPARELRDWLIARDSAFPGDQELNEPVTSHQCSGAMWRGILVGSVSGGG